MICIYCKNKCRLSHKENKDEIEVYDCVRCPVLTSFHIGVPGGSLVKTVFMLDRNEKVYMWTNHHAKQISYITDVGVTLSKDGRDPLVVKFPKVMNINPDNVHEKFKMYMLFI
jgi:hypothetical protein